MIERPRDLEDGSRGTSAGTTVDPADQRRAVRERYAAVATVGTDSVGPSAESTGCCGPSETGSSCCSGSVAGVADLAMRMGYDAADVDAVVEGANLGLGCGNPTAIADLDAGDVVLDLGSGAGFDCFLAARAVGPAGRAIGVDMTPEMVERARDNATRQGVRTVEFRLGEIEHLPVADESVDVIISNCVINLSTDKPRVFREAFRVLRPGGRLAVSDVVRTAPLPAALRGDAEAVAGCVAGAEPVGRLAAMIDAAGFADVRIEPKDASREFIREWSEDGDPSEYVRSATIVARKPD